MVAHFDYYYRTGSDFEGAPINPKGVALIPRTVCGGDSKMRDNDDITAGYLGSIPYNTTCPAIASALSTVLGSYLQTFRCLISVNTNPNIPSMCGANWMGASDTWGWRTVQAILPSEIQIYGSTVMSSSYFDTGEACQKLAVFNFINHIEFGRNMFWLRDVAAFDRFAAADASGNVVTSRSSIERSMRPIIYIG